MLIDTTTMMTFGGVTAQLANTATNRAFSYNFFTGTWTERAPMAVARLCPGCGLVNGKKVVVAGGNSVDSSTEIYDVVGNSWTAGRSQVDFFRKAKGNCSIARH